MSESITVQEGYYDKIGIIHCGVIRGFKVNCAGELKVLDDGEEHLFERVGVTAKRQGGEVTFTKNGQG